MVTKILERRHFTEWVTILNWDADYIARAMDVHPTTAQRWLDGQVPNAGHRRRLAKLMKLKYEQITWGAKVE